VDFAEARHLVRSAVAASVTPAAAVEVGTSQHVLWREAMGRHSYAENAAEATVETVFDLASLTKVIATTSVAMSAVRSGHVAIDAPVGEFLAAWRSGDRAAVGIRHLLDHSSGLPGHLRLWEQLRGRDNYAATLGQVALDRPPGTEAVYSDLGFIVLGFVLEAAAGGVSLDVQFAGIQRTWSGSMVFNPSASWHNRIAPTEILEDGRVVHAEAHDENARAMGGVAGHAGLFGTAVDVGRFARLVLQSFREDTPLATPALMRAFTTPSEVPGSSRALGWDTMRPTSSCGRLLSRTAIGHTGFTGTSLWIDHERDLYIVFLTNRVHPTRTNEALLPLRPLVHEAVVRAFDAGQRGPGP
jgi:CubicO group peptidase (beta-lactamase class C family)